MRIWNRIRCISTIRKNPTCQDVKAPLVSSQVFDPDVWSWNSAPESSLDLPIDSSPNFSMPPATSSETEFAENEESTSSSDDKKKRSEVIEENRSDGHAPIKSALSILMRSLQKSSSMTTSLSDIDVTLFNFHSTKFAERLLNRNVSSVVIVESSHVFSKNAKKFASEFSNVSAYRADIYTLMGVGRKKTAQFPRKMMFADFGKNETPEQYENIHPLTLTSAESSSNSEHLHAKFRRPHLLGVLPTPTIQRTILDSMIQHVLLHHSGNDEDTIFRYGDTNLLTFLGSGILAQYTCSTDNRLNFLSHQHRRHSALFNKLFEVKMLQTRQSEDPETAEIPIGHPPTSFHPLLPTAKKITHEKKLSDVNLTNGLQYPVQILPQKHLKIGGNEVTTENGMGRMLVDYACFMTQIGRQPNAKAVDQVVRLLWPESALSIPADILGDHKIGQLPNDHLDVIFQHVHEELHNTSIAKTYCNELKIKRAI